MIMVNTHNITKKNLKPIMCVRQNVFMLYDDLGLIVAQIYIEPRRMSEMINEFIPPLVIGLVKGWK